MVLAQSHFWPVAIGFFGLGTGYFIWGGQALFGFPKAVPEVDKSMGYWGIWMPGFMQLITGIYLMVGLSWFPVYAYAAPLYMAALAFTAYGTHWLVLGRRRAEGASVLADGWMAIAFFFISVLGVLVFNGAGDVPRVPVCERPLRLQLRRGCRAAGDDSQGVLRPEERPWFGLAGCVFRL